MDDAVDRSGPRPRSANDDAGSAAWHSRPVEVELAAIKQAVEFAGETGCALHVVHVSSPEGLALIAEARALRVDVTAETCSHYLLLNDKDVAKLGAPAKCAPPMRPEAHRQARLAMWRESLRGWRTSTRSGQDHSPAPARHEDLARNFFEIWGGIAGVQHGFQLLLDACATTADKDLPLLAAVLARHGGAAPFPARSAARAIACPRAATPISRCSSIERSTPVPKHSGRIAGPATGRSPYVGRK